MMTEQNHVHELHESHKPDEERSLQREQHEQAPTVEPTQAPVEKENILARVAQMRYKDYDYATPFGRYILEFLVQQHIPYKRVHQALGMHFETLKKILTKTPLELDRSKQVMRIAQYLHLDPLDTMNRYMQGKTSSQDTKNGDGDGDGDKSNWNALTYMTVMHLLDQVGSKGVSLYLTMMHLFMGLTDEQRSTLVKVMEHMNEENAQKEAREKERMQEKAKETHIPTLPKTRKKQKRNNQKRE